MLSKKTNLLLAPSADHPLTALLLLLVGVTLLALQDSLIKFISDSTSFWQIQTLRSFGNMTLIICLAFISGGFKLIYPQRRLAVAARSLVMVVCMFCFFSASPFLSVAQMAAGLYTYPIFVSLLAAPMLGESIGKWRILALIMGAVGAFSMLNPLADAFSLAQLLPIAAGFFYACNIIILRRYCRVETPLALTFANGVFFFRLWGRRQRVPEHCPPITRPAGLHSVCCDWLARDWVVCYWLCSIVFDSEFIW